MFSGLPPNSGHKPSLSQSALCANSRNRGRGLLDQIAGAAGRDGASLWKSRFAEALDIQLKPRSAAARHPYRNAKIRVEFEQTGHGLLYLCFASQMSQGRRKAAISEGIKRVLADG